MKGDLAPMDTQSNSNLQMASNPRYQLKWLQPYFGYDNLYSFWAEIEVALLRALSELGIISQDVIALLTPEVEATLLAITTTETDRAEKGKGGTGHDIRAWIKVARSRGIPEELTRWLHWIFTSYDVISTADALRMKRAYERELRPRLAKVIWEWSAMVDRYADDLQIGRTHGQHAEPITAGFWLATILARILECSAELDRAASRLTGKISGPVGAYNAQAFFGLPFRRSTSSALEHKVLDPLGLKVPMASTQIACPERMGDFLWQCLKLAKAFAQFGDDGRQLMRTEIGEVAEGFGATQDGSSAMPHKRNPVALENLVGMADNAEREFSGYMRLLTSEHQRDLTGSSLLRQLTAVPIYLGQQVDVLLRVKEGDPRTFIGRFYVDQAACLRNFQISRNVVMSQPCYLALVRYGYPEDPHSLMNHTIVPLAKEQEISVAQALERVALENIELKQALDRMPSDLRVRLDRPEQYTGIATKRAKAIARMARQVVVKACQRYGIGQPTVS